MLSLFKQALTIQSGRVTFANVTIAYLEASAVTVTNYKGFLSLSNITIRAANAPCFILPDRERLELYNVTAFGIPINETSPFIRFLDDLGSDKNDSASVIGEVREKCLSNDTNLSCNFSESKKVSE